MYFIKVSSKKSVGKGHINRCLRIREKIKCQVKWFVDKGTKKLFFTDTFDEVYEEDSENSFCKLEKNLSNNYVKAIIIDVVNLNKNKINKLSINYPIILIVDYYVEILNTLRICFHPIEKLEKNFLSGFQYLQLLKKKKDQSSKRKKKYFNIIWKC